MATNAIVSSLLFFSLVMPFGVFAVSFVSGL